MACLRILCSIAALWALFFPGRLFASGTLTIVVQDEETKLPVSAQIEIFRGNEGGTRMPVRRVVPDGAGVVIDRKLEVSFPEGAYSFRLTRGPEYRVIRGNFSLQRESLDEHKTLLPRMIHMREHGWTSGDACVLASPHSLPLRMAAEDLHVAAALGSVEAKPIAGRDAKDPPSNEPSWIREDVSHDRGLLFYGLSDQANQIEDVLKSPVAARLTALGEDAQRTKVVIENPFAWELPVWLASDRIDGIFVLGDWLHLEKKILTPKDGRGPQGARTEHPTELGRWAEKIYWNLLEAGFRIPPLAGSGSDSERTPVGYNRMYVAKPMDSYREQLPESHASVESEDDWWAGAFAGHSVATNGPMLQPLLNGEIPGHVFTAASGETLTLQPELSLTVRDPVDYLEVIHNGEVFYSARLDEFAKAGGKIPEMEIRESSWVMIRVVTLYEDHFRAAMSAPWYVDFDHQPRKTEAGVAFFQNWLTEYESRLKKLPADELAKHVPYIRAARAFWANQLKLATESTGTR